MHRAGRVLVVALALTLVNGCASRLAGGENLDPDPWEGFNRKVFAFNDTVDQYAYKPAAQTYEQVTPDWLEQAVRRFFANLTDLRSALNGVLQWRWSEAGQNLGRFTVNSTMGVAGLFDVASRIELSKSEQDFGLTLARWGFGSGPFLVLPLQGPATLRSTLGEGPDYFLWAPSYIDHQLTSYSVTAVSLLDRRVQLLSAERAIVGDKYTFIRNTWLQSRRRKAGIAPEEDNFGEGFESSEDDW